MVLALLDMYSGGEGRIGVSLLTVHLKRLHLTYRYDFSRSGTVLGGKQHVKIGEHNFVAGTRMLNKCTVAVGKLHLFIGEFVGKERNVVLQGQNEISVSTIKQSSRIGQRMLLLEDRVLVEICLSE